MRGAGADARAYGRAYGPAYCPRLRVGLGRDDFTGGRVDRVEREIGAGQHARLIDEDELVRLRQDDEHRRLARPRAPLRQRDEDHARFLEREPRLRVQRDGGVDRSFDRDRLLAFRLTPHLCAKDGHALVHLHEPLFAHLPVVAGLLFAQLEIAATHQVRDLAIPFDEGGFVRRADCDDLRHVGRRRRREPQRREAGVHHDRQHPATLSRSSSRAQADDVSGSRVCTYSVCNSPGEWLR